MGWDQVSDENVKIKWNSKIEISSVEQVWYKLRHIAVSQTPI